ncbi:GlsB/YeaQ/YmgE family stress response membrane protein [Agarivorans sp. TSD2052]|uniref:GlsB/YeaQ/YmgE family stress response membrane protein n=1 Tax=Agarivorans sp. TSD2052 TaxID=2937286 RepID=UPI00200F33B8|nr:GlsB/YeaQ/YmgE family stress response membrane protein [Agarivorans sp. TSD2052]UPW18302.1 GlsB/YeaQ/YmgE family stress response membrane protein [Agarivorans sp. TSD2052]
MGIIIWLLIGAVAGWLAGNIMKGDGFGLVGNIVVGIVGSVVGGFVFGLLGFGTTSMLGSLITAVAGAVILLYIVSIVKK